MKILLLSGYDAASHKRWREALVKQFPEFQWKLLALPPRHFNWRVRSNCLTWAFSEADFLQQDYDLLIATSMVDLSALRGFVPKLATIPTIVYCHENQFAYPKNIDHNGNEIGGNKTDLVSIQVLNLYTALCADALVFNSEYNKNTFLQGVETMLQQFPDHVPKGLEAMLQQKSQVIPVPLEKECFIVADRNNLDKKRFEIIWNHRWEFDKGPDRLLACIEALPLELPLLFHVVGQQFRSSPEIFQEIKHALEQRKWLGRWGFIVDEQDYRQLLQRGDAVLSTSLHDFQGLAILEAVAAGCVPVVPNRLAYPELFAEPYRYRSFESNMEREAESAAATIGDLLAKGSVMAPSQQHLSWDCLRRDYADLIHSLTAK